LDEVSWYEVHSKVAHWNSVNCWSGLSDWP